MESFGKSSLKAERKELENDPNVAASEEICSPYVRYGLNGSHEFKEGKTWSESHSSTKSLTESSINEYPS